jgi:indolepyruvate decarboxylase
LARLQEIGVQHLFGVPGDYNLQFLDRMALSSPTPNVVSSAADPRQRA